MPACRMSTAKMGRSAVAPPKNTTKKSSEMEPSSSLVWNTYLKPASMVSKLKAFLTMRTGLVRIMPTSTRKASSVNRVKA